MSRTFWIKDYENYVTLVIGIILAALLRFSMRGFESGDFRSFLEPWYDFISLHGGFGALAYKFSNYTPPYLYLMVVVYYLLSPLSKVFAIKLISIVFDFICAFFVYKIVRLKYPAGIRPSFAFLAILFAPTVFLNSAFWGQSDIIYTTGLVACLYFLTTRRETLAFIAFGFALAFKIQAIFITPFLLILLLKKTVSWKSFFIVPVVYIVAILPAWVIGRPLVDLFLIYFDQAAYYRRLAANVPNLYQWIPNELYDIFYPAGLIWTLAIILMFSVGVYKSKEKITTNTMIQLATLSLVFMPYFLPKMHDRYFFPADVISIVFGFYFPQYFYIPIVVGMISLFSYFPFLFGREVIPLSLLAVVPIVIIVILLHHFSSTLHSEQA